jgi:hypothetical protein
MKPMSSVALGDNRTVNRSRAADFGFQAAQIPYCLGWNQFIDGKPLLTVEESSTAMPLGQSDVRQSKRPVGGVWLDSPESR